MKFLILNICGETFNYKFMLTPGHSPFKFGFFNENISEDEEENMKMNLK